jgi:hypothetical protein
MPRSGTGEYSTPLGVLAQPGFTIESAKYNLNINDVANDLNAARPIVAGGTSATNINEALVNLKGERSYQIITNYDGDRFHPGSFMSDADAQGAPIAQHSFAGICYMKDAPPNPSSAAPPNTDLTIEARDFNDSATPPKKYVRQKKAGVWGNWYVETFVSGANAVDPSKVLKSGDTMTGPLILSGNPTSGLQAATKAYVDANIGTGTPPGSTGGTGGFIPPASTTLPLIESGSGSIGGSLAYARADHVHPQSGSQPGTAGNAIPKVESGTGSAGIASAYSREDHVHPAATSGTGSDPTKVPLAGTPSNNPMTGGLIIRTANNSAFQLDCTSSSVVSSVISSRNMVRRWHIEMGDGAFEAGGNLGSDFAINNCSDSGAFLNRAIYIRRDSGNVLAGNDLYVSHNLSVVGDAYKPGGGPWFSSSDERVKTEVNYYTNGLAQVKLLEPVRYTFKGNDVPLSETPSAAPGQPDPKSPNYKAAQAETLFTGLIAQKAELVMPEMVKQVSAYIDGAVVNDLRVLDTTPLIYCLINAIKELAARVETLEAAP